MRFTTRSNLLRHAYRRHGLERGSSERHDVLITLSLNEQKEHAEKEAQRLAKMGEKMEELVDDGEEPQVTFDENFLWDIGVKSTWHSKNTTSNSYYQAIRC